MRDRRLTVVVTAPLLNKSLTKLEIVSTATSTVSTVLSYSETTSSPQVGVPSLLIVIATEPAY